jgi:hypothetical protein
VYLARQSEPLRVEARGRGAANSVLRDAGYEVIQRKLSRAAVYKADEAFLTGTAAEVTPTPIPTVTAICLLLFVGAVAGLAVQQAVYHLAMLRIRTPAVGQQNTRKQQKPGT